MLKAFKRAFTQTVKVFFGKVLELTSHRSASQVERAMGSWGHVFRVKWRAVTLYFWMGDFLSGRRFH